MKKKVFITIDISESLKNNFRDQEKRWKNLNVFWLGFKNLFLTMDYLGVVDKPELNKIRTALELTAQTIPPFTLRLNKIVLGPNTQNPTMFWATIITDKHLINFTQTFKNNLQLVNFTPAIENFTPHIVLAIAKGNQLKGKKTNVTIKGEIPVNEVHLTYSQTHSKGAAKYKTVCTYKLKQTHDTSFHTTNLPTKNSNS